MSRRSLLILAGVLLAGLAAGCGMFRNGGNSMERSGESIQETVGHQSD